MLLTLDLVNTLSIGDELVLSSAYHKRLHIRYKGLKDEHPQLLPETRYSMYFSVLHDTLRPAGNTCNWLKEHNGIFYTNQESFEVIEVITDPEKKVPIDPKAKVWGHP